MCLLFRGKISIALRIIARLPLNVLSFASSVVLVTEGMMIAARMPMMNNTIINSINVNPRTGRPPSEYHSAIEETGSLISYGNSKKEQHNCQEQMSA